MAVEDEHFEVLATLESAVFRFFQENPQLTDYEVDKVYGALVQKYRGEAIGKTVAPARGELAGPLYERVKAVCEWQLGRADLQGKDKLASTDAISVEVLIDCLKRLRKSVDLWTTEGGSQGYLMYISQFMKEIEDLVGETDQIYQFKITLDGIRPPIWRRFQVLASNSLLDLHETIQAVMGWTDSHLHEFVIKGKRYSDLENFEFDDINLEEEMEYRLFEVVSTQGEAIKYQYDFGDSWEHTLVLEKILEAEEGAKYPRCLKGKRACPPEDVGGIWGYQMYLEAIGNPDHPEHEEYLEWAGEEFDPEHFDLEAVNEILCHGLDQDELDMIEILSQVVALPYEAEAENLALRKDAVAFLTYLQENKVIGTKEINNLPRKAVRGIAERFVNPPSLEYEQNGKTHSFRTEQDVPEVFFIHLLLVTAGLVVLGPGNRWMPSGLGEEIDNAPALLQVWLLFSNWWLRGDWSESYQLTAIAEESLDSFKETSLDLLLEYDAEETVLYADFIERLIQEMALVPGMENRASAVILLTYGVQGMLIDPLVKFGMLQKEFQARENAGREWEELHSFKLTAFGKAMLEILD
jgi:hypothetical protein